MSRKSISRFASSSILETDLKFATQFMKLTVITEEQKNGGIDGALTLQIHSF